MHDLYAELMKKDGQNIYTLTRNIPARMRVDDQGLTIHYQSGNKLFIPKQMAMDALRMLEAKGVLTLEDVHEKITLGNGARTDRLMAALREIPGVRYTAIPRTLSLDKVK
jgi:hypothetical protein